MFEVGALWCPLLVLNYCSQFFVLVSPNKCMQFYFLILTPKLVTYYSNDTLSSLVQVDLLHYQHQAITRTIFICHQLDH